MTVSFFIAWLVFSVLGLILHVDTVFVVGLVNMNIWVAANWLATRTVPNGSEVQE